MNYQLPGKYYHLELEVIFIAFSLIFRPWTEYFSYCIVIITMFQLDKLITKITVDLVKFTMLQVI